MLPRSLPAAGNGLEVREGAVVDAELYQLRRAHILADLDAAREKKAKRERSRMRMVEKLKLPEYDDISADEFDEAYQKKFGKMESDIEQAIEDAEWELQKLEHEWRMGR
jgi:hypothetical protein